MYIELRYFPSHNLTLRALKRVAQAYLPSFVPTIDAFEGSAGGTSYFAMRIRGSNGRRGRGAGYTRQGKCVCHAVTSGREAQ
jgi:hypothetical protein